MRKLKLYIAISLDGKIAKPNGDVKWLEEIPNPDHSDYGYADFYQSIDTTVMGFNTYHEIIHFGTDFPYPDKINYVFTRKTDKSDTKFVHFITGDIASFIKDLKKKEGKDIWLVGGAQMSTLLLNHQLIDELYIFVMPVVIGEGIPLWDGKVIEKQLKLADFQNFASGVVMLKYEIGAQKLG